MGSLTANGQVYLYNPNGFVFGKGSSVDVNTLVTSTLNITDDVFKNNGIINEFGNNNGGAALKGKPGEDKNNPCVGGICVEAGANVHVGKAGQLIMAGRMVDNKGNLQAGQYGDIILVASKDKVYLQPASKDSPLSGLWVEVGTGGKVNNSGEIKVKEGNVTLAGFAVNQAGLISATTSVNVNGSIRLLAREGNVYDFAQQLVPVDNGETSKTSTTRSKDLNDGLGTTSNVTFATGSVTQIVADDNGGKPSMVRNSPFHIWKYPPIPRISNRVLQLLLREAGLMLPPPIIWSTQNKGIKAGLFWMTERSLMFREQKTSRLR